MRRIVREEAVMSTEDLLLRRLDSTEVLVDRTRADMLRHALPPLIPDLSGSDTFARPPVA